MLNAFDFAHGSSLCVHELWYSVTNWHWEFLSALAHEDWWVSGLQGLVKAAEHPLHHWHCRVFSRWGVLAGLVMVTLECQCDHCDKNK